MIEIHIIKLIVLFFCMFMLGILFYKGYAILKEYKEIEKQIKSCNAMQKKTEAWRKVNKLHYKNTNSSINTIIDDKLTIEEAKKHYSKDILQHDAFLHGVEWAENQLDKIWHNIKEKPRDGNIITIDKNLYIDVVEIPSILYNKRWESYCKYNNIIKWTYINSFINLRP